MQNINPLDGTFNPAWDTSGSTIANHADLMTGRSVTVWGNQHVNAFHQTSPAISHIPFSSPSLTPTLPPKVQIGNYTGRNFDANYHQNRNHRHQPYRPIHYNQPNYQANQQPYQSSSNRGTFSNGQRGRGRGGGRGGRGRPAIGPGSYQSLAIEPAPAGTPEVMTPGGSVSS